MKRILHGGRDNNVGSISGITRGESVKISDIEDTRGMSMGSPGDRISDINTGSGPGIGSEKANDESEDLLVFGYESKLYRDDEKAEWIEKYRHLIPWLGDDSILVDRYDVRGLLTDCNSINTEPNTPEQHIVDLDSDDQPSCLDEVERLSDRERYMAMNDEGEDELTFHEMEFKRLQSAVSGISQEEGNYSSVGFNYDENAPITVSTDVTTAEALVESFPKPLHSPRRRRSVHEVPFMPPAGLVIPPGMIAPTKMKVHSIIEKTAKFVAAHGAQMEIIVKTKQAHNKQFNFLYYDDPLNEYYKNLLLAIKENKYKPSEETSSTQDEDSSEGNSEDEGSGSGADDSPGYLHPSLMKSREETAKPLSFNLQFRPAADANSAYSMLVSRIKEVTGVPAPQDALDQPPPPPYPYQGDMGYGTYNNHSVDSAFYAYGNERNGYQGGVSYGDAAQQVPRTNANPPERSKPNSEEQTIIEKMASYVIKNGPAFEAVAGTKGDPRFQFLDPAHRHHWYYLNCKKRFSVEASAVVACGDPIGYSSSESTTKTTQSSTTSAEPAATSVTTAASMKANHANAVSRMATLPPELINKIEELRKKTQQHKLQREAQQQDALVEKKPVIKFSSSLANLNLGGSETSAVTMAGNAHGPLVSYDTDDISEPTTTPQSEVETVNVIQQPSTDVPVSSSTPASDIMSRKEERRRKVALFLQRLKRTSNEEENSVDVQSGSTRPTTNDSPILSTTEAVNSKSEDLTFQKSRLENQEDQEEMQESLVQTKTNGDENDGDTKNEVVVSITEGLASSESPGTPSSANEVHQITIKPEETLNAKSRHRRHKRSHSRGRSHSRNKTKRKKSGSSNSSGEIGTHCETVKTLKHKSHKKRKHRSRSDEGGKSKKSLKKKKKHHKSSKSRSRKSKLRHEKKSRRHDEVRT